MASVTLYANQTALVLGKNESYNQHGNEIESSYGWLRGNIFGYTDAGNVYVVQSFAGNSELSGGVVVKNAQLKYYAQIIADNYNQIAKTRFLATNLEKSFNQNTITAKILRTIIQAGSGGADDYNLVKPPSGYTWRNLVYTDKQSVKKLINYGFVSFAELSNPAGTRPQDISGTYSVYSCKSSNKSYLVVEYEAPRISVYPGFQEGLFIAKNLPKNVSWSFSWESDDGMIGTPAQTSAEVRCKSGGTTKTIYVTGSATTATIPAGTFTESSGQIQIAISTTAGGYAESNWITVNTTDSTGTAVAISPRGVKIDGAAAQVFSWTYESPTGTPQTKAELQVSYDGGGRWQELATAQGNVRQTKIPAGTLEAGAAAWRVRCFNSDGTPGEYSDGAYIIVAKNPSPPSYVTTNAKPRLTVEWASRSQQGYQVQVMRAEKILFDSGTVFGLDKQITLPDFLADGSFTTQVRIIDKQGLWSEWTKIDGSVQNVPAESISAETKKEQFGLTVEWSTDGEYQAFYLLRDGVPIGKATGREWTDWTANGKHKYTVRGVKGDGYYTDSDTVVGVTAVPYGAICLWDDFTHWMLLKLHEGGPFVHTENRSAGIEYVQYAGRALPVAYETGWKTVSHTVEYTVRKATEWEALKVMEGQMVIYKDYRGARVIGMLESVDAEHTKRINFSLTIQETDVQERVAYD